MTKQVTSMPSLEVLIERLPKSVLDSARGPVLMPLSDKTIQSPVKHKSPVKTRVLRDLDKKAMPCLQVTLERLPKKLMRSLLAQKKIYRTQEKRKVGRPKKIRNSQCKDQPPIFDFISV